MNNIDTKTLISIISTIFGVISALISKLFLNKLQKLEDNKNKLRLRTDMNNIENRLKTFYIPIYIKLFIISLTKKQIKCLKIKSLNDYIFLEKNSIIKLHNDIIDIITHHYGFDYDDDINISIIKNYIHFVITYNNIRKINNNIKPSELGIKLPKDFAIQIENKIINLQNKYNIFLDKNNKNISLKEKLYNYFNCFFKFVCKSKINKNNIYDNINNNNKWSISEYIKNNINIDDINKIIINDTDTINSFDSIYNKIDLNEIILNLKSNKLNNMIFNSKSSINTILDIPFEK